jgi:tetratricopeptide (TPR) repeat protein
MTTKDSRVPYDWDQLAQRLLQAALAEGDAGVQHVFADASAGRSELEQQGLVVQFAEFLVRIPSLRSAMLLQLGPAIQALGDAGQYDLMLRGLATAARIQLAAGTYAEVPALIESIGQVSQWAASPYHTYLAEELRAKLLAAQGQIVQAINQLENVRVQVSRAANFANRAALLEEILTNLVLIYTADGDFKWLAKRLDELDRLTAPDSTPLLAYHRGVLQQALGHAGKARQSYQAAIQLSAGASDQRWAIEALVALSFVDPDHAEASIATAAELVSVSNDSAAENRIAFARIRADLTAGRYTAARQHVIDLRAVEAPDLLVLCAEVFATAGPPEMARSLIAKLLDTIGDYGLSGLSAQTFVLAASVATDADEQARYAGQALEKFTNLGDTLGRARALVQQGQAALRRGDPEAAIISAQDILEIAQAYQQPDLEATAELIGGLAVQANDRADEATASLERALALAQQQHLIALAVRCLEALGKPQRAEELARAYGLEQ